MSTDSTKEIEQELEIKDTGNVCHIHIVTVAVLNSVFNFQLNRQKPSMMIVYLWMD